MIGGCIVDVIADDRVIQTPEMLPVLELRVFEHIPADTGPDDTCRDPRLLHRMHYVLGNEILGPFSYKIFQRILILFSIRQCREPVIIGPLRMAGNVTKGLPLLIRLDGNGDPLILPLTGKSAMGGRVGIPVSIPCQHPAVYLIIHDPRPEKLHTRFPLAVVYVCPLSRPSPVIQGRDKDGGQEPGGDEIGDRRGGRGRRPVRPADEVEKAANRGSLLSVAGEALPGAGLAALGA